LTYLDEIGINVDCIITLYSSTPQADPSAAPAGKLFISTWSGVGMQKMLLFTFLHKDKHIFLQFYFLTFLTVLPSSSLRFMFFLLFLAELFFKNLVQVKPDCKK